MKDWFNQDQFATIRPAMHDFLVKNHLDINDPLLRMKIKMLGEIQRSNYKEFIQLPELSKADYWLDHPVWDTLKIPRMKE